MIKENFEVYKAQNGYDGLSLFYEKNPSIVILDLMLPDISGEAICREIREKSDIPLIMLTAKSHEENELQAFSLGADDFIRKPFNIKELIAKVNVLLCRYENRGFLLHENIIEDRYIKMNMINKTVSIHEKIVELTPTEYKLLELFMRNPNRTFSREKMMQEVFEYQKESFERTIDTHIKNLRNKIEHEDKNPEFIKTIFAMGYHYENNKN
ncbi:MAG: response regulator transcription factor [Fusobacteria bacterium]|nr:response regulator transcription factor [Fusobacteriota bacterium]